MAVVYPLSSPTGAFGLTPTNLPPVAPLPGVGVRGASVPPGGAGPLQGSAFDLPRGAKRVYQDGTISSSQALLASGSSSPFFGGVQETPRRAPTHRLELYSAFNPSLYPPTRTTPFMGSALDLPSRAVRAQFGDMPRNAALYAVTSAGRPVLFVIT